MLLSQVVAATLLLGRDKDVRRGGRIEVPEEQLRPEQEQSPGALPHAEEGQAGRCHRLL